MLKHSDPDIPRFNVAVHGGLMEKYVEYTHEELAALIKHNTCITVPCNEANNVITVAAGTHAIFVALASIITVDTL